MFRCPQGDHAGEGGPDAFLAAGGFIDDEDIGDFLAHEGEGGGEAALARADDEHVEHRLAIVLALRNPGVRGVVEAGEIGMDAGFEVRKRHGRTLGLTLGIGKAAVIMG